MLFYLWVILYHTNPYLKTMKNLKSSFTLFFAMLFIAGMSFTSCGGKKDANNEAETEIEAVDNAENAEHPADSSEHPADSTESPADNK